MAGKSSRGRKQGDALALDFGDEPAAGTAPLPGTSVRRPVRRVEASVSRSIQSARAGTEADPRWSAAEALARELGRGIDIAAYNADPYALAQLGPKLLEVLRELALTPASATVKSELDELLADMGRPD